MNTINFLKALLLVVSTTSSASAQRRGLRGNNNIEIPTNYDEHLENMKKTSVSIPATEMTTMTKARLADGVFDIKKAGDRDYMQQIFSRCLNKMDTANPEEVLGCQLLFDKNWDTFPQAMGTLKIGTDILNAVTANGEYDKNDINILFKDHALATMVEEGCFVFDSQSNIGTSSLYSYSSQESYKREIMNGRGGSFGVQGKALGITANASYNMLTTNKNKSERTKKFAFGEKYFSRNLGVLTNQCFTSERFFKEVIVGNNLIKDEWVKRWEFIQMQTDANKLAQSNQFQKVAMGGVFMPSAYTYTSSVSLRMETSFASKTTESSLEMSAGLEAGLKLDFHKIGQQLSKAGMKKAFGKEAGKFAGMITGENLDALEKAMNDALKIKLTNSFGLSEREVEENTDSSVSLKQVGTGVSAECLFDPSMDCNAHLAERVNDMRSNLVNIGKPNSQRSFISLHDIVTWYTGSGLGDQFDDALEFYFSYAECNDVGSEFDRGFQIFNGNGKKIESGVCARDQHMACGAALFLLPNSMLENSDDNDLVQEVQGEICQELTYTCDVPGNVDTHWIEGKNKITDNFGNLFTCGAREVCQGGQDRKVHNKNDLCAQTWRCQADVDPSHTGNFCFFKPGQAGKHCCPNGRRCNLTNLDIAPLSLSTSGSGNEDYCMP